MLLKRNLGKSKLLTLPVATVKNRICKKNKVTYLVKMARGTPGAEYSHLDRTQRPVAYCLQKQAQIMNSDKRPRPQL